MTDSVIRIWMTRDEAPDGPLSQTLANAGLVPVYCPVVHRTKLGDASKELEELGPEDWLVITSAFAIDCLDNELARRPRVAVVGKGTESIARMRGLRVELVNPEGRADSLWESLRERVSSGIVCHPRSSLAAAPEPWDEVSLLSPVVYETMGIAFDRRVIERVDAAAVVSPSAVRAIGRVELPLASLGQTTSAAIRQLGMEPWIEAPQPTFSELAGAIAAAKPTAGTARAD